MPSSVNFQLETLVPVLNKFMTDLSQEWNQNNFTKLFTFEKLLIQCSNIHQLLIESVALMVAATIAIVIIEAVLSVITTIIILASLASALIAIYQAFSNQDHDNAVKYAFYTTIGMVSTSLIGMISPLLILGTMGLVGYKAFDLIQKELPESVKKSSFAHVKNGWIWCSGQIDALQEKGNALFGISRGF